VHRHLLTIDHSTTFSFSASRAAQIAVVISSGLRRTLNVAKKEMGKAEFIIEGLLSHDGQGKYSSQTLW
jgi:hypothetical protein